MPLPAPPEPGPECPSCTPDPCWFLPGYPWCRSCAAHHRPPECPIDQDGRPLAPCGDPWDDVLADPPRHRPDCPSV